MFDPTNGEKALDQSYYDNLTKTFMNERGGATQHQQLTAWRDFTKEFGRNPTQSELDMLAGTYAGDPNFTNDAQGKQAVSQYFNSIANSPDNLNKNKQAQLNADAPKYYDQINGLFQSKLGRDANDAEKEHFGTLMAGGNVDSYAIGQFLDALPENVQKQDAAFRSNLSNTLQGQDSQYYKEQILPALQANAAKQGRSLDSSGVTNSLALAAQQQNREREGFLSGLTAQQYAGSQGLAQQAYQQAYGNYQDLQNYNTNRNAQLSDAFQGRVNSISDYNIQKQAYDQYLQRYGKRSSGGGIGSLIGTGLGAGLGALFAAPTGGLSIGAGAALGGSIGGSLGGGVGAGFGGGGGW